MLFKLSAIDLGYHKVQSTYALVNYVCKLQFTYKYKYIQIERERKNTTQALRLNLKFKFKSNKIILFVNLFQSSIAGNLMFKILPKKKMLEESLEVVEKPANSVKT